MEGASRAIERIIKAAASNNIVIDVFLLSTFTALGLRSFNQQNNIQALEAEKESLTKSNKAIRRTLWDWKQQLYAEASTDSALVPLPRLKSIYGESPAPPTHSGDTVKGGERSSGSKIFV